MENVANLEPQTIEDLTVSLRQVRAEIMCRPLLVRLMAADLNPYLGTLKTISEELGERHTTVLAWAREPDFPAPVLEFGQHSRIYCRMEVKDWVDERRGR